MTSNPSSTHAVTRLLLAWSDGDPIASDQLMALVYDELRDLARHHLRRERHGHTLQPTALVHEAYLRMVDDSRVEWRNRAHFYGIAARVMRRILVDHARRQLAAKRGGGHAIDVPLDGLDEAAAPVAPPAEGLDIVALDHALGELARTYPRQGNVVELKFFGGLTAREIGEVLQVNERTVLRDWEFARSWLRRAMQPEGSP